MTSFQQLEHFDEIFKYLNGLPEDAVVEVFDLTGKTEGHLSKKAAIERTRERATVFAQEKAKSYLAEFDEHIRRYNPRSALAVLRQRTKLEAYLSQDDRITLNNAEREAREAIQQLEKAETIAEEAQNLLTDVKAPLAWARYREALDVYEGALAAEKVVAARQMILDKARRELTDALELLQERTLPRQDENLVEAGQFARQLIKDYSNLDNSLNGLLAQVHERLTYVEEREEAKKHLNTELQAIQNAGRDNPDGANRRLRELERQYLASNLLSFEPLYGTVKAEVETRLDADSALRGLRELLSSTDRERLAKSIENARNSAQVSKTHAEQFSQIARQLELHLEVLNAQNAFASRKYEQVIKILEAIQDEDSWLTEPDRLLAPQLLEDARDRFKGAEENLKGFEEAEQFLREGHPREAVQRLLQVKPANQEETRNLRRLSDRAKTEWLQKIEIWLKSLTIETEVQVVDLEDANHELQDLDEERHRRWKRRIDLYLPAQVARNYEAQHNYESAQEYWKIAAKQAQDVGSVAEQQYITRQLRRVQKLRDYIAIEDLLKQGQDDSRDFDSTLIAEADRLNKEVTQTSDPDYRLWLLKVLLLRAQFTQDAQTSANLFTQDVLRESRNLERQLNQVSPEYRDEAKLQIELGKNGPMIGEARAAVDQHLAPEREIDRLIQAVDLWDTNVSKYEEQFGFLKSWYDRKVSSVTSVLADQVKDQEIGPDNLEKYAKLAVLGDKLGDRLLERLPRMQADLKAETDLLIKGVDTGDGYQGISGTEILHDQVDQLKRHLSYLETIDRVIKRFQAARPLQAAGQGLSETVGRLRNSTQEARQRLERLTQSVETFNNKIQAFDPAMIWVGGDWNEYDQWKTNFDNQVSELRLDLHPIVAEMERRHAAVRKEFEGLLGQLQNIRRMIEDEEFSAVLVQEISRLDMKTLRGSRLFGEIKIQDKWSRQSVQGWQQIDGLAKRRKVTLDRVLGWASPFLVTASPLTVKNLLGDVPLPDAVDKYISWERAKPEILTLQEQGDFNGAIERTNIAGNSLDDALKAIRKLPIGEIPQDSRGRELELNAIEVSYHEAIQNAGTERGAKIIKWVYDLGGDTTTHNLEEAHQALNTINARRVAWDNNFRSFKAALREIARAHVNKNNKGKLAARRSADEALYRASTICPQHPLLEEMAKNYYYQLVTPANSGGRK